MNSYAWSIPERVVRAVSALAGGALREISEVALPTRVRRTRLYQALVDEQGSGSEEVRSAVERARTLCLNLGDTQELVRVQDGLFNYYFSHCLRLGV